MRRCQENLKSALSQTRQDGHQISGWEENSNLLSLQARSTKSALDILMATLTCGDADDQARRQNCVPVARQAYQEARQKYELVCKDQVLIQASMDLPATARSVSSCHQFLWDLHSDRRHVNQQAR